MIVRNYRGVAVKVVAALLLVTCAFFAAPKTASAICARPQEQGVWYNVDPETRSITRLDLRFVCQDFIGNGQVQPPGPPWYVHVFGSCHPSDCDWSEVGAQHLDSGHIYAVYEMGYATTYLWAKMSELYPGELWVYTWTDFADPNRADFESQNWFSR